VWQLQQLLEAAALTLADALLDRCRDVRWALKTLGVRVMGTAHASPPSSLCPGTAVQAGSMSTAELQPAWVLDVAAATEAQERERWHISCNYDRISSVLGGGVVSWRCAVHLLCGAYTCT
jgi:hypothetical protein